LGAAPTQRPVRRQEVRDLLLSLEWHVGAADAVTKICSDVIAGKRLRRTMNFVWPPPERIDEWRREAEEAEAGKEPKT
jgi:hypothetical protein